MPWSDVHLIPGGQDKVPQNWTAHDLKKGSRLGLIQDMS